MRNSAIRCETLKMQYQGQPKCHCQCFLLTLHQLPPTSKSSRLTDCVTPLSPLRSQKNSMEWYNVSAAKLSGTRKDTASSNMFVLNVVYYTTLLFAKRQRKSHPCAVTAERNTPPPFGDAEST